MNLPENQQSQSYDIVSQTNLEALQKNSKNKPYKLVYRENDDIKISELKNERRVFVELNLPNKLF